MTLKELLDTKIIYDNVYLDDGTLDLYDSTVSKALKVFNRPTEIEDFKPNINEYLNREVKAVFAHTAKYTVIIQLK